MGVSFVCTGISVWFEIGKCSRWERGRRDKPVETAGDDVILEVKQGPTSIPSPSPGTLPPRR